MTEITFDSDLYTADAVEAAAAAFEGVVSCEKLQADGRHRIRLTLTADFPESQVADEFRNYVLGATIESAIGLGSGTEGPNGNEPESQRSRPK